MAEQVGQIYYDVTADVKGLIVAQREIDRRLGEIEKRGEKFEAKFSAIGAAVASMFAAGAVVAELKKMSDATKDFEKAIDDLSAITGATGKQLQFLENSAKEFGLSTSASAIDAVTAMKLIASAKPELLENAAALKSITQQAIILADASGMALPKAAESLTLALNQMGAGADQAGRFINVMAAGAKFGASEISESSESLKQFAVSARGVGLSIEEANAGIQALAAVGIKGGESGTALRNVLLKLENEADKTLKPSINGLAGALDNLGKKNLDTASLTKLFGLENINAANALIGSTDNIRLLTSQLTGTNTALEQAETNTDNYAGSLKRMENALQVAAMQIGEGLNPLLRSGADLVTKLAVEMSEGSDRIETAMTIIKVAAMLAAGAIAGPLVASLATAIIKLYASATAMGAATIATRTFTGVLALLGGPIGIAITALSLLAFNWDKITGAANNAANISENAAARIAGAQKKSDARATRDLTKQLSETESDLAGVQKELAKRDKKSVFGGFMRKEDIELLEERRDAYVKAIDDIKAALYAVGKIAPSTEPMGPPESLKVVKKPKETVIKPKKDKFDPDAYLAGLKKETVDAYSKIGVVETEATRKAGDLLKEKKLTREQYEKAITMIAVGAEIDRSELVLTENRKFYDEMEKNRLDQVERDKTTKKNRESAKLDTLNIKASNGDPGAQEALLKERAAQDIAAVDAARLLDLENEQIYADQKLAIEMDLQAKLRALRDAQNSLALTRSSDIFSSLTEIARSAAGEQSGIYKAMFAASKAFAIADSIVKIQAAMASAAMSLPFPANLGAIATVAAATANIVSTISSTNIAGGRQYGGPVSAGSMYRVNETGKPEMFTANNGSQYMMPTKSGKVTAADSIGGNGDSGVTVIINNAPAGTTASYDAQSRSVTIAVAEVARQIASNSGQVWSAMKGSTNVQARQ